MSLSNATLLAGRLLLAASFLPAAIQRVSNLSGFAVTLAGAGVPSPTVAATAICVAELFGPLALVLGLAPRLTAAALATASVVTTLSLHRFWDFAGPARAIEQAVFLTELGIVAALLFYAASGPGEYSWQAWWRAAFAAAAPKPKRKAPARPRTPRPKPQPRQPAEDELADAA